MRRRFRFREEHHLQLSVDYGRRESSVEASSSPRVSFAGSIITSLFRQKERATTAVVARGSSLVPPCRG
jgi:hypothetical protein